jgi:anti-anti-sigma factor
MTLVADLTGLLTAEKTPMTTPFHHKAPPSGLERRACPDQSAAVVTLPNEIDVTNASQVYDALTRAQGSGTRVVVADASQTTFCDCAGLRTLIRAHDQAAAAGIDLRVAAATSRKVRRILELTGAAQVLDIYPTLTAALAGPRRAPGTHPGPAQAPASPAPREHASAADPDAGMP